jgi:hypothetical protein
MNACSAAATCRDGECVCDGVGVGVGVGVAIHCAGACVDASSDVKNCGRCGLPCSLGETCAAGQCVKSSGGDPGSDGCEGLARGVTLSSASVYQGVEIPIMMAGVEVAEGARRAPVLTRKPTLFRLHITLEDDFTARPLAGRVFVENEGTVDVYSEQKTVRFSSKAFALESTFQILVPKQKIQETTRYRVELVECGGDGENGAGQGGDSGGGALPSPRYPGENGVDLGARAGGTLRVTLVPMRANGFLPDTSARALALYEAAALAVYPVSSVELSVGRALEVANARDWNGMLDAVRARRRADAPPHDVYYYGMLKPRATLAEYCGTTEGCTTGLGFLVPDGRTRAEASIRASVGLAYANLESAMTMLHELGHNHGRDHAPCNVDPSDVDPDFPYPSGSIGGYGWDHRRGILVRPGAFDLMSYCLPPWISDYTYNGLFHRMIALSSLASANEIVAEDALGPWRVLLLDELGPRWGIPIPQRTPASGVPESALALDRFGRVLEVVQVYRAAIPDAGAAAIEVPEPKPAWFSVQVAGAPALAFSASP